MPRPYADWSPLRLHKHSPIACPTRMRDTRVPRACGTELLHGDDAVRDGAFPARVRNRQLEPDRLCAPPRVSRARGTELDGRMGGGCFRFTFATARCHTLTTRRVRLAT